MRFLSNFHMYTFTHMYVNMYKDTKSISKRKKRNNLALIHNTELIMFYLNCEKFTRILGRK